MIKVLFVCHGNICRSPMSMCSRWGDRTEERKQNLKKRKNQ